MQSYKDLEIYKISHALAIEIHKMTLLLPSFETHEEGKQIRKSAKSIPSNIVEGFGRKKYQQDYLRFLSIAHASCNETLEHLEILHKTDSLRDEEKFNYFFKQYDMLGRKLNKFIQAFEPC
jgi:four helix bundle protein